MDKWLIRLGWVRDIIPVYRAHEPSFRRLKSKKAAGGLDRLQPFLSLCLVYQVEIVPMPTLKDFIRQWT
jgi:hypothetical protein